MNVPLPGESPLKTKPGNGLSSVLIQMGGFVGAGVLVLPELILAIVALATGQPLYAWLALAVGARPRGGVPGGGHSQGRRRFQPARPRVVACCVVIADSVTDR